MNTHIQTMHEPAEDAAVWARPIVLLTALLLIPAFYLTEHDWRTSTHEAHTSTADEMEMQAGGGNTTRRVVFVALAMAGCAFLVLSPRRTFRSPDGVGWLLALALGWCFVSVLWSVYPPMTVRRLVVLACLLTAALGAARRLTPREMTAAVLIVTTFYMLLGIASEAALGMLRPWQGGYRFSGSLHPNTQGLNLVALCFSSFLLARTTPGARGRLMLLFAVAFVMLLLTKSRTSVAGVIAALVIVGTLRTPTRYKVVTGFATAWLAAAVVMFVLLIGFDPTEKVQNAALLGRQEQAASLTGRLPIWEELTPHISHRPWLGHGYDTFWSPDVVEEVSAELNWGIREAHNAYIDSTLSVGLIGTVLGLLAVLAAIIRAGRLHHRTGDAGAGFIFALLIFGLINGLTESGMTMPMFIPFIAVTGILQIALHRECALESIPAEAVHEQNAHRFVSNRSLPAMSRFTGGSA